MNAIPKPRQVERGSAVLLPLWVVELLLRLAGEERDRLADMGRDTLFGDRMASYREQAGDATAAIDWARIQLDHREATRRNGGYDAQIDGVLQCNLFDLLGEDYDDPSTTPEWAWVEANQMMAHRGNNKEPGVYEYLVYVSQDSGVFQQVAHIPPKIWGVIQAARQQGCVYILFHQG